VIEASLWAGGFWPDDGAMPRTLGLEVKTLILQKRSVALRNFDSLDPWRRVYSQAQVTCRRSSGCKGSGTESQGGSHSPPPWR